MTISEFKVMTVFYDAAMGHTSGGIINMNTQSGTDHYHGELHEFLGNSYLNAKNYFAGSQKKPVYQDNRYGASIGGPVFLPHIYNGKNRTFFYYAFEGNKWGTPQSYTGTVPTAAEREGDFSALLALGSNYTVYDPDTTVLLPNNTYKRTPFPNNVIPSSRLSATAQTLVKLYPLPNAVGSVGGVNNYVLTNLASIENYYAHFARVDHTFSDRSRMFLRADYDNWDEKENMYFGADNPASGHHDGRTNAGIALDEVYSITPLTILDVRYGLTAQKFPNSPLHIGLDLGDYGFASGFTSLFPPAVTALPNMTFTSFAELGESTADIGESKYTSVIHSFSGSITQLVKNHNLHYGVDARINRANQLPYSATQAALTFGSTYTNGPFSTSASSPLGQDFASFMLGIPGGTVNINSSYADQDLWFGGYLQDDWRVTPKLTLNLGLRLEHETPVTERYNRAVSGFDSSATNPISAVALANYAANPMPGLPVADFAVRGGLTFSGGGNGRGFWKGQPIEVMPRLAFAYQADGKTVVRGGYGIFYDTIGVYRSPAIQTGYSATTSVLASLDNGLSYSANLTNPVPGGLIQPLGAAGGLTTALGQALSFYSPTLNVPYAERWSFNIQRELPGSYVLDVSYVGNHGVRLPVSPSINSTPNSYLSTSSVRDQATINYLNQTYPNPFYGLSSSYTKTVTRAQLVEPYPEFGTITDETDIGSSHYDSLQVELKKRFTYGYSVDVAYTHSRLLDALSYLNPADPHPWYGVSTYDRPNRLAVSALWDLPFGHGEWIGNSLPTSLNYLAGGWQLNSVVTYQSGDAFTWGDVLFTGKTSDIPLGSGKRSINEWFNTSGFVTSSSQQLADNVRTFPLRLSNVRGDGQYLWNFSAIKAVPIHDSLQVQFRAEAYNAFNHPNMADPNVTPTSSAFGKVTSMDGYAREIQLALRVLF